VRWIGTETGLPIGPIWSTGCDDGTGDPNSTDWCPAGCDTTLQVDDRWFWMPNTAIRPLNELINVYHATVGQNGVLELDFAIDRTGNVASDHAQRYRDLGNWIRSCYNYPLDSKSGNTTQLMLSIPDNITIDRIMIQENLTYGQRIRQYIVEVSYDSTNWSLFSSGTSVGNKKIDIGKAMNTQYLRLTVTGYTDIPSISKFAVFMPCATSFFDFENNTQQK